MTILPWQFLLVMQQHIGRAKGVTVVALAQELHLAFSHRVSARDVREIVHALRMDGHHICAHPRDGYFMASTPEELDETLEFLYSRSLTSFAQIAAMKRVSLPDLRGQLRLSTT